MPRPGPRPYECVRRAWHSDRHQSMRGSIIQQILKVVHEHHSSVTKKNKEWLEKLPVVVFKAEEIMYSKANSESEYMDLGTLWDRVNDAVDTIIRKDETAETGGLLPPCVEAALNLGCVPVRASRSQRHSNPRNYLSPRSQEPTSSTPKVSSVQRSDPNPNPNPNPNPSLWSPTSRTIPNLQKVPLVSGSNSHIVPDINLPPTPSLMKSFTSAPKHIPQLSNPPPSVSSVYPLYYGTNFQNKPYPLDFQAPQNHSDIIVGTPVYAPFERPSEIISARLVCPSEADEGAPSRTSHGGIEERSITEKPNLECDLSLRLGPVSDTDSFHWVTGSSLTRLGSDPSFSKGDKVDILSTSSRANELRLFSLESANDSSRSRLAGYNLDGEGQSEQISSRKRKNAGKEQSLWL